MGSIGTITILLLLQPIHQFKRIIKKKMKKRSDLHYYFCIVISKMYLYFTPASVEGHKNNLCTFVQLYIFWPFFIFLGRRKKRKVQSFKKSTRSEYSKIFSIYLS